MNIRELIGEATEYDKKLEVEIKKPKSWCKSVSAFANTLGEKLIFGIADEGQMFGLENPEQDAEKISEIIKIRLDPIPEFKLSFHSVENGKVLIILDVVNALAHRDYLVNGSEVHIDIYDDRMEIYSPGGMPDGSVIQEDPYITQKRMAELLGLSRRTVQRLTETMITDHVISRVGSKRTGQWEIL